MGKAIVSTPAGINGWMSARVACEETAAGFARRCAGACRSGREIAAGKRGASAGEHEYGWDGIAAGTGMYEDLIYGFTPRS